MLVGSGVRPLRAARSAGGRLARGCVGGEEEEEEVLGAWRGGCVARRSVGGRRLRRRPGEGGSTLSDRSERASTPCAKGSMHVLDSFALPPSPVPAARPPDEGSRRFGGCAASRGALDLRCGRPAFGGCGASRGALDLRCGRPAFRWLRCFTSALDLRGGGPAFRWPRCFARCAGPPRWEDGVSVAALLREVRWTSAVGGRRFGGCAASRGALDLRGGGPAFRWLRCFARCSAVGGRRFGGCAASRGALDLRGGRPAFRWLLGERRVAAGC